MTVWECMQMLGRHQTVRIFEGETEITAEPLSSYEYQLYADEYPTNLYNSILQKSAKSVDLEQMIIYCEK